MKKVMIQAVCMLIAVQAFGATKDDPSITVTGEAKMRVPADQAYIVIHIDESDNLAMSASKQAFEDMDRVLEGVDKKKKGTLVAQRMASAVSKDSEEQYTVAHTVRISCSPKDTVVYELIDEACKVYGALKSLPALNSVVPVSPVIYAVEDYEDEEEKLEQQALDDARRRAEVLAAKAGKTLGDVLSIQTSLISAKGRELDLPTPYISDDLNGVMMYKTVTVSYQLLSGEEIPQAE